MAIKIHKHRANKKLPWLIALAVIVVAILATVGFLFFRPFQDASNTSDQSDGQPNLIDNSPDTIQKESNIDKGSNTDTDTPSSSKAVVTITKAAKTSDKSTVQVRAYVSNAVEDGGKCTAVFKKSGYEDQVVTSTAFADATTTQCGVLDIASSEFPSTGTWRLSVSYTSSSFTGEAHADVSI
jgi:cytoskeletal protein RodZ